MLLRQIKIENFLSHEEVEISLPAEGTFLLSGESGIGKSSLIIDAIAYSLYGAAATRGKKQVDLRNNDNPKQPMQVDTVWDFENETVIFSRGIDSKNSSWAKAYGVSGQETVILAEGIKPVSRLVSKRMGGMSWQQFYSAFVARQDEITLLTTLKGSQRKDLIHRMLGMRELEKSEQIITQKLRRLKATADQIEKSIGGIDLSEEIKKESELKKEFILIKEEITDTQKDLKKLTSDKKAVEDTLSSLKKDISDLEDRKKIESDIETEEKLLETMKTLAAKHRKATESLKGESISDLEKELDLLKSKRDDLRSEFVKSKDMAGLVSDLGQFSTNHSSALLKLEQVLCADPAIDKFLKNPTESYLDQLIDSFGSDLEKQIKDRRKSEELVLSVRENDQCFVCQRPFSKDHDHNQIVLEIETEIVSTKELESHLNSLIQSLESSRDLVTRLSNLQQEIDTCQKKITAFEESGVRSDFQEIKELGRRISEEIKEKESRLQKLRDLSGDINEDVFSQFQKTEKNLSALRDQLEKIPNPDPSVIDQFDNLSNQKSQIELEVASRKAVLNQLETSLVKKEKEVDSQQKIISGREHEFKQLDQTKKEVHVAESATLMIRGYQRHLTSEIRPAIEEIASEMITRISEGRHVAVHINDEYELSVEKASGAILSASLLSGGEEIRANICLRLALTRLVSQRTGVPVGFLILDEPLPAQDSGHIERIMELLEGLRSFYRQQFIISHVGDLRSEDSVDYIIEFERSSSGKTEVSVVNA